MLLVNHHDYIVLFALLVLDKASSLVWSALPLIELLRKHRLKVATRAVPQLRGPFCCVSPRKTFYPTERHAYSSIYRVVHD